MPDRAAKRDAEQAGFGITLGGALHAGLFRNFFNLHVCHFFRLAVPGQKEAE
jgi:hypothetical protein